MTLTWEVLVPRGLLMVWRALHFLVFAFPLSGHLETGSFQASRWMRGSCVTCSGSMLAWLPSPGWDTGMRAQDSDAALGDTGGSVLPGGRRTWAALGQQFQGMAVVMTL